MADANINQGVQILLNRMDSHPEEFVPDLQSHYPHKWRALLLKVDSRVQHANTKHLNKNADLYTPELSFLSDEEIFALHGKVQSIRGDLFTKEVMATLLADEERNLGELSSSLLQPTGATITLGTGIGGRGTGSVMVNSGAVSGTIIGKLRYP
jgi:hypothetical protein